MPVIARPQLRIHQELSLNASVASQRQLACIIGPNARLHRYGIAAEKALIGVGAYNVDEDTVYTWPNRSTGGVVDQAYTRLLADDALLLYHQDLIGDTSGGRGTVAKVANYPNRIRSSTLGYTKNGSYNASSLFGDRGVKIGDRVRVRGAEVSCDSIEFWTSVAGFAGEPVASSLGSPSSDAANQASVTAALSVSQTSGIVNCVGATIGGTYSGIGSGRITENYTVIVTKAATVGCNNATVRVISASGTDDVDEVTVALASAIAIGTRGATLTWADDTVSTTCDDAASAAGLAPHALVVGQTWVIVARQVFNSGCITAAGTYTGAADDVYRIECTKGGLFASGPKPEISITTVNGQDLSGPTQVTAAGSAIAIGSHGVTITYVSCPSSSTPTGLRKGDVWYVPVTAATTGRQSTLILQDDLPSTLVGETDLDLFLYLPGQTGLEITQQRLSSPPNVNYSTEETQIVVKAGVTAYDSDWTVGGTTVALPLAAGSLYVEYREWLPDAIAAPIRVDSLSVLEDAIPGQLDPDNPLSYGVFKALQNSGGQPVYAMAVATPAIQDWLTAYGHLEERAEFYNIVPMSFDSEVIDLAITTANQQSGPGVNLFKGVFCGLQRTATKMIVGQSAEEAQAISPTSTDGLVVLAKISDNPQASGTQYTLLQVPAANGGFVTYGVKPGDTVRTLFTVDAYSKPTYTSLIVDSVISESSLLLKTGVSAPISQAQKVEIWRTLSAEEMKDELKARAQAISERRVCAVWPDALVSAGRIVDGYYAAAALAGLRSGALPHRPLTNISISGFDSIPSARLFRSDQIDDLMNGGVWVLAVDRNGLIYTVNAITTDVTDLNHRTESVRTNLDDISAQIRDMWSILIGSTNVSPVLLRKMRHDLENLLTTLGTNGLSEDLGSQVIITPEYGPSEMISMLRVKPTAADEIEVVVKPVLPYPFNVADIYLNL